MCQSHSPNSPHPHLPPDVHTFVLYIICIYEVVDISPAWDSRRTFHMMYSVYKLNKWGDNVQTWYTLSSIWNLSIVPCPILIVASYSAHKFLMRQVKVKVKVSQSCMTLWDPKDYTVHEILQARIVEWVAYPLSSRSSWPRNWTGFSSIAGRFFTNSAIREALVWYHLFKIFPVCCDLYSQEL